MAYYKHNNKASFFPSYPISGGVSSQYPKSKKLRRCFVPTLYLNWKQTWKNFIYFIFYLYILPHRINITEKICLLRLQIYRAARATKK